MTVTQVSREDSIGGSNREPSADHSIMKAIVNPKMNN